MQQGPQPLHPSSQPLCLCGTVHITHILKQSNETNSLLHGKFRPARDIMASLSGQPDKARSYNLRTAFVSSHEVQHHDRQTGTETWRRQRRLGQGGFSEVWQETCTSGARTNQVRAIKQIKKNRELVQHLGRELEVLVTLCTAEYNRQYLEHFVQFLGWFGNDGYLFIALEMVPFGDLQQHIAQKPCSEEETAIIIDQIARALHCMHSMGIVHRDLKPGVSAPSHTKQTKIKSKC